MAISVELGPALDHAVNTLVALGRYGSKSELLRVGVRLVQEREARLVELQGFLDAELAEAETHPEEPTET